MCLSRPTASLPTPSLSSVSSLHLKHDCFPDPSVSHPSHSWCPVQAPQHLSLAFCLLFHTHSCLFLLPFSMRQLAYYFQNRSDGGCLHPTALLSLSDLASALPQCHLVSCCPHPAVPHTLLCLCCLEGIWVSEPQGLCSCFLSSWKALQLIVFYPQSLILTFTVKVLLWPADGVSPVCVLPSQHGTFSPGSSRD